MYKFEPEMKFEQMQDTELTHIGFGPYDVSLSFSAGLQPGKADSSWSIQCRISTSADEQNWTDTQDYKQHALTLLQCLSSTCSFSIEDERTLKLTFSNCIRVLLHDDSDQYESVIIEQGGQTTVI